MKKILLFIIFIISAIVSFAACSSPDNPSEAQEGTKYLIYYINNNRFYTVDYYSKTDNAQDLSVELLSNMGLMGETDDVTYLRVTNSNVANGVAYVYFNDAYKEMDNVYEVLFRASVVKTLTQLPDVNSVYFYVDNKPLTYDNGRTVGQMQESDFIASSDDDLNNMALAEVTLYWGSEDGKSLKDSNVDVAYTKTVPLEKIIIEQLIKGPDEAGLLPVLPEDMKIISVTVKNEICYVNLDSKFTEGVSGIPFEVSLYSIVNSLCELDNVNKVQFQINGDSHVNVGDFSLDKYYEKKYDIIGQEVLP